MINLLPAQVKEQIRFARLNAKLVNYFWLTLAVAVIVSGVFTGSYYYLSLRIRQADSEVSQKQLLVDRFKDLESQVKSLNSRLTSIKTIQSSQSKFSLLFNDLAAITPKGVFINSINLTGDDKKPVQITATATSYNAAVAFRDALAASPRVQAVDILSTSNSTGSISVSLNLAFKPGMAK